MDGHSEFFDQAQSKLIRTVQSADGVRQPSPLIHCVPRLLALLAESHDQPMHEVSVAVRQIVFEHSQPAYVGDGPAKPDPQQLSACADRLIAELEKLRRAAVRHGMFSDAPVPPLMCG
jgi:hypothetical protein